MCCQLCLCSIHIRTLSTVAYGFACGFSTIYFNFTHFYKVKDEKKKTAFYLIITGLIIVMGLILLGLFPTYSCIIYGTNLVKNLIRQYHKKRAYHLLNDVPSLFLFYFSCRYSDISARFCNIFYYDSACANHTVVADAYCVAYR